MPSSVSDKLTAFRQSESLQARFERSLAKATVEEILWPDRRPSVFGRTFVVEYKGKRLAYPLLHPLDRLLYVEKYIDMRSLSPEALHPVVVYYYLKLFLQEYEKKAARTNKRPPVPKKRRKLPSGRPDAISANRSKRSIPKSAKKTRGAVHSRREPEAVQVVRQAKRILRKLEVPSPIKRARDATALNRAVLSELQELAARYAALEAENQSLGIESELYMQAKQDEARKRERIRELEDENGRLETELQEKTARIHKLEEERLQLADRLMGETPDETALLSELNLLRHEYNLLSQKYDALVSKNIELSNRLNSMGPATALEDVLNSIRDRVNRVLRSALSQSDDLLIAGLQSEIDQLKRARIYLGRALYDIGMLYLRSGRQGQALRELRAARELGVESHETNVLLGRT